jgi:hypothetical protein
MMSLPVVSASTVNITLNPTNGIAKVTGVSTTTIVFTYPVNSSLSNLLKEYNYSLQVSGNIAKGQVSSDDFQDALRNYTPGISVENMSASLATHAVGNSTALVVTRVTNLTAYVTGIFNVTDGKVMANLGWKAFAIKGSFEVPMDGQSYDLNLLGSALVTPLGRAGVASSFLASSFGGESIWSRSTIDFSALSTPLSNWTRVYNPATNTTTFTKNVNAESNYSSSVSFNGQKYTLSMVYDPSSSVKVLGYANPVGDSLVIESPPPGTISTTTVLALVAFIVVAVFAFVAIKRRSRPANRAHVQSLGSYGANG